jgi:hypothetical protein
MCPCLAESSDAATLHRDACAKPQNPPQGLRRCLGPIKMRVRQWLATRGLSLLIVATALPPPIVICSRSPAPTPDCMLMAAEAKPEPLDTKLSRVGIYGQEG